MYSLEVYATETKIKKDDDFKIQDGQGNEVGKEAYTKQRQLNWSREVSSSWKTEIRITQI